MLDYLTVDSFLVGGDNNTYERLKLLTLVDRGLNHFTMAAKGSDIFCTRLKLHDAGCWIFPQDTETCRL